MRKQKITTFKCRKPLLFFLVIVLFSACQKTGFKRQTQNPAPFNKTISVKEARLLYDGETVTFPDSFFIEGVVVSTDNDVLYLQDDNGNPGLKILYSAKGEPIEAGQEVIVNVGGKSLNEKQSVFTIEDISEIKTGEARSPIVTGVSTEELRDSLSYFTSTLVSLDGVKITDSTNVNGGITYKLSDSTGSVMSFIPEDSTYFLPDSAERITGVVVVRDDDIFIDTRSRKDIQEIVPPPTLFELILNKSGLVKEFVDTQTVTLADGVKMYQGRYIGKDDNEAKAFTIFGVDLSVEGTTIAVGMKGDGTNLVDRTSLVDMAKAKDDNIQSEGLQVVGAINGDQFGFSDDGAQKKYMPYGPVVKGGVELKSTFYASSRDGFLALLDDGSVLIGHKSEYENLNSSFEEAAGGEVILEDGEVVPSGGTSRVPRTSIGYTKDGIVYTFQGDGTISHGGQEDGWSIGFNNEDMSLILQSLGAVNAIYTSAGDYSISAARTPNDPTIHNVSRPAWIGHGDAWMTNSWLIIAKK